MQLRLNYPPTVENAPKFAADIVGSAAEISGVDLDYSPASLKAVNDIVEGMRQDGCTSDQIATTLFDGDFPEFAGREEGAGWRKDSSSRFRVGYVPGNSP